MQPKVDLEDVGVLELLKHDDRPTFVLEKHALHFPGMPNTRIVFRNNALEDYVREKSRTIDFEDWARALSEENAQSGYWNFAGRAWASTAVLNRWIIVYCSQTQDVQKSRIILPTEEDHRDKRQARGAGTTLLDHKPSQVFSDSGDTFARNWEQKLVPQWSDLFDGTNEAKVIDWTRYHIEDLPPYIQYIKQLDWASTALGPMSGWSDYLRRTVVCAFSNPDPRLIFWGEHLVLLYNEAATPRLGHRHPAALGRPVAETFAEVWPQVGPLIQPTIYEGRSVKVVREVFFMERNGILEETYWNFVIAPLLGENGYALGALDAFTEQTQSVMAQRRREIISHLSKEVTEVTSLKALWSTFLDGLSQSGPDIPFAFVYTADDSDSSTTSSASWLHSRAYSLEAILGVSKDNACIPESFDLNAQSTGGNGIASACRRAANRREPVVLRAEDGSLPADLTTAIPGRGWGDSITTVCVMPVVGSLGFLVLALNPRRPLTEEHLRFAQNVRDILAKPAWTISQQRFEEIHESLARQLKMSTLAAARNEDKFTKLAESSPIGISTFGVDGKTLYVNDEYLNLIGVERDYGTQKLWDSGNQWHNEIVPEDLPVIAEAWRNLTERKSPTVTIEYRTKRPWRSFDKATGSEITGETWLINKATAEFDEAGELVCIHAWLLDVSHQHYVQNLLAQRLEDALETKRQTNGFIDMVSHELRNPLSSILQSADGILTLLEEAPPEDAAKRKELRDSVIEAAQTICLCAQHQKCIVDDILTLSKLDSNLLVITPDKVQPPSLIEKVLKMYEGELNKTRVQAHLEIDQSYTEVLHNHDYVMLDPSRLLQVIINLLTNAMKFTQYMDERKITIHLAASYEPPSGEAHGLSFIKPNALRHEHTSSMSSEWGNGQELYLQLAVQDTGRGLSEEEMKILFQRFSQASPKTYKEYGGSGLGLFISRKLTELQGGQIGVGSKGLGKGSTFAFYVRARRCLLEDSTDTPTPVALQHVWNVPVNTPVNAPVTATVDLTMTNSTSQAQLENGEKPAPGTVTPTGTGAVTPKRPRVSRVPTKRKSRPSSTASFSQVTGEPLHVLIVEDNLINQKVMAQQLRRIGCIVHIANHGLECLSFLQTTPFWKRDSSLPTIPLLNEEEEAKAKATPEPTPLSVVLLDWEMPVMDGITCVKEIRRLQSLGELVSHVPVIAVTANARGEQISVAMEAGMDELVTKPFRIPDLVPQMEALAARFPRAGSTA